MANINLEQLKGEIEAVENLLTGVEEISLNQNGQIAVHSALQNIDQARLLMVRSREALSTFATPTSVKPSEQQGKRGKQVGPQEAK